MSTSYSFEVIRFFPPLPNSIRWDTNTALRHLRDGQLTPCWRSILANWSSLFAHLASLPAETSSTDRQVAHKSRAAARVQASLGLG